MITAILLWLLSKLRITQENSGLYKPSQINFAFMFSKTCYLQHQQLTPTAMTAYSFYNNVKIH
jgi:hypothetical protein